MGPVGGGQGSSQCRQQLISLPSRPAAQASHPFNSLPLSSPLFPFYSLFCVLCSLQLRAAPEPGGGDAVLRGRQPGDAGELALSWRCPTRPLPVSLHQLNRAPCQLCLPLSRFLPSLPFFLSPLPAGGEPGRSRPGPAAHRRRGGGQAQDLGGRAAAPGGEHGG